jgi:hypothetical protein
MLFPYNAAPRFQKPHLGRSGIEPPALHHEDLVERSDSSGRDFCRPLLTSRFSALTNNLDVEKSQKLTSLMGKVGMTLCNKSHAKLAG